MTKLKLLKFCLVITFIFIKKKGSIIFQRTYIEHNVPSETFGWFTI